MAGGPGGQELRERVASLAKRRGFLWPSYELYGGLRGFFDWLLRSFFNWLLRSFFGFFDRCRLASHQE